MRWTTCAVVLLLGLASVSWAQTPRGAGGPDKDHLPPEPPGLPKAALEPAPAQSELPSGVAVGARAPDFALDGSQGATVRLSDLEGGWAVMVFANDRSTLGRLKGIDGDVRKLGARLVGVCRDGAPALRSFAEREKLPFVILSDLTGEISQIYGMYDDRQQHVQPGIVLIDPKGIVRMAVLGPSLHADEVLQLVRHTVAGG
jgi:peroxiredoxin